ncbi:MAG: response regulator transcription factor [Sedimentisphaerales bacterium]|nr:response regulator transcription factor [Sedimentisphaerales bacterium]
MTIKILLADDHAIVRHGLSRSLQQEDGIEVVGQAQDGFAAVKLALELSPHLVIMDISMPGLNGIEAVRKIVQEQPRIKIIALSMHSSDKYVREMFKAGAAGYLLKDCPFDELLKAIKTVMADKVYISPSVGDTVIQGFIRQKPSEQNSAFSKLTPREREVLQLLAEGYATKQIGLRLGISPKTVEVHRSRIMEKLGFDNIAQLTKYAIQEGLTQAEP